MNLTVHCTAASHHKTQPQSPTYQGERFHTLLTGDEKLTNSRHGAFNIKIEVLGASIVAPIEITDYDWQMIQASDIQQGIHMPRLV